MHNAFSYLGLRIPIRQRIDEMLLDYLTISKKIVRPKKRNILITPELENKLATHNKRKEAIHIKDRLESGD